MGGAAASLIARMGLGGAEVGEMGGPAGVLAGALGGAAIGTGAAIVQGLMHSGGTGGE